MWLFLTALFLSLRKHFLINGYYRFTANDVNLLQMHIANKTDLNGLSLIEESDIVLFESIDMIKDNVLDILDVTELQLYIVSTK